MRGLIGGFMRLPGTAERFVDLVTGNEVSRRQRDNILRSLDAGQRDERLQLALSKTVGSIVRDYIRETKITQFTRRDAEIIRDVFRDLKSKDVSTKKDALRRIGRMPRYSDEFY